MNKKGFTLVELLAVIIILSALVLLASTSVTKIVRDSKNDLYETQIKLIEVAAKTWASDNIYDLPEGNTCKYIKLKDLKSYGLIDSDVNNPKTNEPFSDDLIIKIQGELNKFGNTSITYEVGASNVDECEIIYPVCKLIDDADNSDSVTPGDKYQCKVKDNMEEGFEDGYYFFVLSNNEDETVNLIMERNIYYDSTNDIGIVATEENPGLVEWISNPDYGCGEYGDDCALNDKGPITAMNYLYSATKDWTNIPNIIMNYKDENIGINLQPGTGGYGSIKTTNNITIITNKDGEETNRTKNLKARMPKFAEVYSTEKCTKDDGSCPLWLVNYLSSVYLEGVEGLQKISGIDGYWILSSSGEYNAMIMHSPGSLTDDIANYDTGGVRPVITIPTNEL